MLFEAVLVSTLLFADLAVPAQALEAFGFHFVGDVFGASYFGFWHGGGVDGGDARVARVVSLGVAWSVVSERGVVNNQKIWFINCCPRPRLGPNAADRSELRS